MNLNDAILKWDQKSRDDIAEIYTQFSSSPDFLESILKDLNSLKLSCGGSWLLKEHLESGATLSKPQEKAVVKALLKAQDWQTQLHLLQVFAFFQQNIQHADELFLFLRLQLSHDNKFIRAWSYNAIYLLAEQNSAHRDEANKLFSLAMRDEAASVKARLRNCVKKSSWAKL